MPGPSTSFAGAGQRDGVAASPGRGRGSHSRLASHQNRNGNTGREPKPPGRGRGVGIIHRGKGEASGTSVGARNLQGRSDGVTKKITSNSPFAPLKQQIPPRPADLSGNNNKAPSFTSAKNNSGGFGAPSAPDAVPGFSAGWNQDRRRRHAPRASSLMANNSVPVEEVGMMSSYHERYEKVSLT